MKGSSARWLALLVVLAAAVPYLPTIDDYFTQDDFGVVQLLASKPWTTFPRWFAMPWMEHIWGYTPDEIRPFVAFTYQVTALAGAGRPELHHVVNILFHAANSLLVMALAHRAVGLTLRPAAVAGVVFAVLPVQAESVAWITGRVDSMPAFFYLATFLAYVEWRKGSAAFVNAGVSHATIFPPVWYGLSLVLFFIALFSKQNTITMVATLAVYDLLVLEPARRGTLVRCAVAWLPFAAMTAGYLLLRRALFGASVRGGVGSRQQLVDGGEMIQRHLWRTLVGNAGPLALWEIALVVLLGAALVVVLARTWQNLRRFVCFGLAWWIIGVVPVVVAGYESPRHVYLASAALAFSLACLVDARSGGRDRPTHVMRLAPAILVLALLGLYTVRLAEAVRMWGVWAHASKVAVEVVAREAARAEPGTLLIVSVPRKSWEWATPFVLQPPYAPADFSGRVNLVTPFRLYCCGPDQWDTYTRERLRAWASSAEPKPIVAIRVGEDAAVSRATDRDIADLRTIATILPETDSWQTLNEAIIDLTEQVIRTHR